MLAAAGGLGFSAVAGTGMAAGTIGAAGSAANSAYSAFSLGECLKRCNEEKACKR